MREQIFAAADALFAADESGDFPNVEVVRQVMTVRDPLPAEPHGVIQEAGLRFLESALKSPVFRAYGADLPSDAE
ncbi:hypothetical protein GXI07_23600 [Salmonella enterica subsp. enterica]|nr:hypothetical protein [Salmonella enterica subsp. enterica serovar Potsdam]